MYENDNESGGNENEDQNGENEDQGGDNENNESESKEKGIKRKSSTDNNLQQSRSKNPQQNPMSSFKPQRPVGINKIQSVSPRPETIVVLSPTSVPKPLTNSKNPKLPSGSSGSTSTPRTSNLDNEGTSHPVSKPKGRAKPTPRSTQKAPKENQSNDENLDDGVADNYPPLNFKKKQKPAPRAWNRRTKQQKDTNNNNNNSNNNNNNELLNSKNNSSFYNDLFDDSPSLKDPSILMTGYPKKD